MHAFTETSESGYGACAFLRLFDEGGDVSCKLLLCQSRVVPRKKQIVTRFELTAARIGAKPTACVQRELDLPLDATVMWTAICAGLHQKPPKRFQMFVANREAAIHQLTKPDQWRYVDGKLNPADMVSRGLHASFTCPLG